MKHLLLTTIAAVLVGCATTQSPELQTGKSSYFIGIYDAAYQGNIEAIKKYIADGTDVNVEDIGFAHITPLHIAASEGHKEVVELLITKGADLNAKSDDEWTPLRYAAANGHKEIAELLIAEEPIYRKPFALYENCNCIATRDNCCQTISKCSIARKNIDASH